MLHRLTHRRRLCPDCYKIAPDIVAALTHAPYQRLPTKKKRQQSNAVSFSVWAQNRRRKREAFKREGGDPPQPTTTEASETDAHAAPPSSESS